LSAETVMAALEMEAWDVLGYVAQLRFAGI
jgi:hypothetical protein